ATGSHVREPSRSTAAQTEIQSYEPAPLHMTNTDFSDRLPGIHRCATHPILRPTRSAATAIAAPIAMSAKPATPPASSAAARPPPRLRAALASRAATAPGFIVVVFSAMVELVGFVRPRIVVVVRGFSVVAGCFDHDPDVGGVVVGGGAVEGRTSVRNT